MCVSNRRAGRSPGFLGRAAPGGPTGARKGRTREGSETSAPASGMKHGFRSPSLCRRCDFERVARGGWKPNGRTAIPPPPFLHEALDSPTSMALPQEGSRTRTACGRPVTQHRSHAPPRNSGPTRPRACSSKQDFSRTSVSSLSARFAIASTLRRCHPHRQALRWNRNRAHRPIPLALSVSSSNRLDPGENTLFYQGKASHRDPFANDPQDETLVMEIASSIFGLSLKRLFPPCRGLIMSGEASSGLRGLGQKC